MFGTVKPKRTTAALQDCFGIPRDLHFGRELVPAPLYGRHSLDIVQTSDNSVRTEVSCPESLALNKVGGIHYGDIVIPRAEQTRGAAVWSAKIGRLPP